MEFEWDSKKEQINIAKHGIDFKTAICVFEDPEYELLFDNVHSSEEDRYIAIGRIKNKDYLVCVVFTERKNRYRIITARRAGKEEEVRYYDSKKNN